MILFDLFEFVSTGQLLQGFALDSSKGEIGKEFVLL
jgi:hypothetical protein